MLIAAGVNPKNIVMCDSKGILTKDRKDIIDQKDYDTFKYDLAQKTNGEGLSGDFGNASNNDSTNGWAARNPVIEETTRLKAGNVRQAVTASSAVVPVVSSGE